MIPKQSINAEWYKETQKNVLRCRQRKIEKRREEIKEREREEMRNDETKSTVKESTFMDEIQLQQLN